MRILDLFVFSRPMDPLSREKALELHATHSKAEIAEMYGRTVDEVSEILESKPTAEEELDWRLATLARELMELVSVCGRDFDETVARAKRL